MWSEAMHVCQFLVIAWSYTVSLFENFAEPFTNRLGAKCCISWNLLISHLSSCCLCLSCGTNLPSRSTFSPKLHTTKSKLVGLRVNFVDKISSKGEIEDEINKIFMRTLSVVMNQWSVEKKIKSGMWSLSNLWFIRRWSIYSRE